ncbi:hypothetical protein F3087_39060 [Nocardia colli]|uniref:Uncharacterized protein n=1 Tax=Nocardia colli TaxID=2545717 RepID=A0A5N0DY35_9NOCA|nr:hypothetical protein [Nocardia colli]KAA8882058.1 hypothetical protein F3087_39060 [Nocardia colli]
MLGLAGSLTVLTPLPAPAAAAEVEKHCSSTREINRDDDVKANIAVCVETDGNRLTVSLHGDCFYKGIGWSSYDSCDVSGSWRLTRGGAEVVAGDYAAVRYPGPGDYEISATVSANGTTIHSNGSYSNGWVQGTISVPVSFTSAPSGPRLGASIQPASDGKTVTLTLTNSGPDQAGSVTLVTAERGFGDFNAVLALEALKQYHEARNEKDPDQDWIDYAKAQADGYEINQVAQTQDPRCVSNKRMSECQLGPLAGGASTTVAFTAEYANDLKWRISSPDQVGDTRN